MNSENSELEAKIESARSQLIGLELLKLGLDEDTAKRANETITALRQESNKMTEAFKAIFQPLLEKKPEDLTETDKKVLAVIQTCAENTLTETARGFALGSESVAANMLLSAAVSANRNLHLLPLSAHASGSDSEESADGATVQVSSTPKNKYIG